MRGKFKFWHIVVLCIGLALIGTGLTLWYYPPGAELSRGEMKAITHEFIGGKWSVLSINYIGDNKWKVKIAVEDGIRYLIFEERYEEWSISR
jgi:hypothetical protein